MNPLLLLSPRVWAMIGLAAVLAFGSVQTMRLRHAKGDLVQVRADLQKMHTSRDQALTALKLSEDKRAVEFSRAVSSAGEMENACSARVKAASRSAVRIRSIVERPVVSDARGCPARETVSAEDLRRALQP